MSDRLRGALFGLSAAALFGVSAPIAKLLLPQSSPLVLAALLYLGGGLALVRVRSAGREAKLTRADLPLLLGITVAGGIAGPLLMLVGLQRMTGVGASLLLNLEGPLTALLAVTVFREHLGRRGWASSALIFAGAVVLSGGQPGGDAWGAVAIASACAAWALDNNLTQRLSLKDPVSVVRVKALGAGGCMLAFALMSGQPFPSGRFVAGALLLGAFGYGVSIVLDTYALRLLGAAREAAYFATAPFVGAVAAIPLLGESLRPGQAIAGVLMAAGVALLLSERHGHVHTHEVLEHTHLHVHDEHHQHAHDGPVTEPHSHAHRHEPITHDHPHVSDVHHRHRHD
ncbi:MAG: EamA family transporter [Myxococcaceae bacterium]